MSRSNKPRARAVYLSSLSLFATLVVFLACAPSAFAQRPGTIEGHPIPTPRYYNGIRYLESGDFTTAARFYTQELRTAFRIGAAHWLDSICYYAMIGESYYQAGDLETALDNYNAALAIAMAYPNWMARVTYIGGVSTVAKPAAPWGASRRPVPIGVFPSKATIVVGDKITEERLKQGGMITEQKAIPIDPSEILRCTALSIRRRAEILGPIAPFDPISHQIVETFRVRAVAPNHWSITWLDVIWGLALSESGKDASAVTALTNALLMGGAYDHTLTGTALFELGNLYMKSGKVREAAQCYYEASISAYNFGDNLLVEESIRNFSNAAKALGRKGGSAVVNAAYRWAKQLKNTQTLTSSFGLELVEDFIYQGKLDLATSGLGAVDKTMRATAGQGLRTSRAADRWNYLNALLFYANGAVPEGDAALAKVVEGSKVRSPWATQLLRLDNYVKAGLSSTGALTPRNAADLYEYLLREPTVVDWAFRPTEALSIQMIAPSSSYERWFCILMDRDLKNKAFEVAERVRRERFFRTQTFGGRLLSLRYILTADAALTTPSIRNARQALIYEYPAFAETVQASAVLVEELNSLPTVPPNGEIQARQVSLFARLAEVSATQEALMRFIAAGRTRIPYVFPPVYTAEDVQKRLPPDTAVLAFLDAEGETFGFMIGKENLDAWRIGATSRLGAAVGTFLRTIGNSEGTRQVEAAALAEANWKSQGAKMREIVLGAQDVDADRFNIVFSKLVVVPDSVLWYLPFEALCLPAMASTVEEVGESDEEEAPEGELDQASAPQDAASANEQDADVSAEEEDDLDSAYRVDDSELPEDADEEIEEELLEEEPIEEEILDEELADEELTDEAEPVKRKSRSTRLREELEAYEATLIPMIQASELSIRYSATVSLALPNALGRNAFVETTITVGSTYPREPVERVDAAVDRFAAAVSKTEPFRVGSLDIPGALYASRLKRLVVFDEIVANTWNWAPFVPGKARGGHSASDWIASPWGAPRLYVAPALRTRAEDALKNGGDGSELFLPILAMQASGADGMLLSRWRTGGRSAYDLTTDFVKNYESEPSADAWKHAALQLMKRDVVVDEEPRLRKLGRNEEIPKYDSPFWWAGYMLIDSGEAVRAEELDVLDEDAIKKAEAEKALLEDGGEEEGVPAVPDGETDEEPGAQTGEGAEETGADEEGVVIPIIVDKTGQGDEGDDSAEIDRPLNLGPQILDDDALATQDEEGDDFFAVDEEDEPGAPEEEPGEEEQGEEEASPEAAEEEPSASADEPKVQEKDAPKAEVKPRAKAEVKPKDDSSKEGGSSEPKSKTGKVSLKPKSE